VCKPAATAPRKASETTKPRQDSMACEQVPMSSAVDVAEPGTEQLDSADEPTADIDAVAAAEPDDQEQPAADTEER